MDSLFKDEASAGIATELVAEYTIDKEVDVPAGLDSVDSTAEPAAELEPKPATATDATSEAKFGEQLTQLEGIVTQLESGQLDLEDSLKRYEEGVQLIRALQTKLADAEQKVQVMMGEISSTIE